MPKIISANLNGIRSAAKKGFFNWMGTQTADFICVQELKALGREVIICGDWNIAHHEIDLKNWKGNKKNSGFLPEERAWLTRVFDEVGFVDVHRGLDKREDQYTWWSNRGQAYAKNVGWRIDYHVATPGIAAQAHTVNVYKDERFSDHAPLIIDYTIKA